MCVGRDLVGAQVEQCLAHHAEGVGLQVGGVERRVLLGKCGSGWTGEPMVYILYSDGSLKLD